ncbi:MAG: hypothetical protein WBR33_02020 [Pseudonocardiaceae bacterium]
MFGAVLAGAEQLEGLDHKRCPFGIEGDGADFATFGLGLTDVEVAELSRADTAAVLNFLPHLVAYIRAASLGLVLVNSVDDRLDHGAFGCFAHVEYGGDYPYAVLTQFLLGDGRVDTVAEDAIEMVDDDVVRSFVK